MELDKLGEVDEDPGSSGSCGRWQWQLANRITTIDQLKNLGLGLTEDEEEAVAEARLPFSITPYYAGLMSEPAVRRSVVPAMSEMVADTCGASDPLREDTMRPVKAILHRYPDRVCLLATRFCSTVCRYCTRARLIEGEGCFNSRDVEEGIKYIRDNPAIRDVLVTGGDPLTLSTRQLDGILTALRGIPHVEIVRIGTKVPAVLPMRIDDELVAMLKKHHPLFINIHFIHPAELTPECGKACAMLADVGIPLGSQTVLLKGVNDDPKVMRTLMQGLLKFRVRPYYLYVCDHTEGNTRFRTSVDVGLEMVENLRGWTSGLAVPQLIVDSAEGKIPVLPDYSRRLEDGGWEMRGFRKKAFHYAN